MAGLALLAAGDAEQAAGRLAPVLGLPAEMRLATFAGRLSAAGALASAPAYADSSAARGIAEQVGEYLGRSPGDVMPYPSRSAPGQPGDRGTRSLVVAPWLAGGAPLSTRSMPRSGSSPGCSSSPSRHGTGSRDSPPSTSCRAAGST